MQNVYFIPLFLLLSPSTRQMGCPNPIDQSYIPKPIDPNSFFHYYIPMTKEKLIETIMRILNTDADLNFLLRLKKTDLETLLACIRSELNK